VSAGSPESVAALKKTGSVNCGTNPPFEPTKPPRRHLLKPALSYLYEDAGIANTFSSEKGKFHFFFTDKQTKICQQLIK